MTSINPLGNFERLSDLLAKSETVEAKFWSDLRPTGYTALDHQIGGLRAQELTVIASQQDWLLPDLILQMVETIASTDPRPVLHILVNTSRRSLIGMWCQRTEATCYWRTARFNDQVIDHEKLLNLKGSSIYCLDVQGCTMKYIINAIEAFAKNHKELALIYIQGIERIDVWNGFADASPAARWATVSSELKSIAFRHDCPVVIDCSIPFYESDETPIDLPTNRHLPHEGALACSADLVLMLEANQGVCQGEPADLYSIYSRHQLICRTELRYDHIKQRWSEAKLA